MQKKDKIKLLGLELMNSLKSNHSCNCSIYNKVVEKTT